MSLFSKISSALSDKNKDNHQSWVVILKGTPDKKSEEALMQIFSSRLHVPEEDAQKIIHSVPIILFDQCNAREAEQMKLALNQTGARTAISNDPQEFKKIPRVSWPKKVALEDLTNGVNGLSPRPVFSSIPLNALKPVVPLAKKSAASAPANESPTFPVSMPETPVSPGPSKKDWKHKPEARSPKPPVPAPASEEAPCAPSTSADQDWKRKYEELYQTYLELKSRFEKREDEFQENLGQIVHERDQAFQQMESLKQELLQAHTLSQESLRNLSEGPTDKVIEQLQQQLIHAQERQDTLEGQVERLIDEREKAYQARDEAVGKVDGLCQEIQQGKERQNALEKEIGSLKRENEKALLQLAKIKGELENRFEQTVKQRMELEFEIVEVQKLLEALGKPVSKAKSSNGSH